MNEEKLKLKKVKSGDVGGVLFECEEPGNKPTLVLFNQWRSGAASIFSKYLAQYVFDEGKYGRVLFIDRVASGGQSRNTLTESEVQHIRIDGENKFADEYCMAIKNILEGSNITSPIVLGGSSAGCAAVIATALASARNNLTIKRVIVIEPSGLRSHGISNKGYLAVPHAFARHSVAYLHRLRRGWWTPMDREQYFAKGKMFENRARYWASARLLQDIMVLLNDSSGPALTIVLCDRSHVHRKQDRKFLDSVIQKPHILMLIPGQHDHTCQPPILAKQYSLAV